MQVYITRFLEDEIKENKKTILNFLYLYLEKSHDPELFFKI